MLDRASATAWDPPGQSGPAHSCPSLLRALPRVGGRERGAAPQAKSSTMRILRRSSKSRAGLPSTRSVSSRLRARLIIRRYRRPRPATQRRSRMLQVRTTSTLPGISRRSDPCTSGRLRPPLRCRRAQSSSRRGTRAPSSSRGAGPTSPTPSGSYDHSRHARRLRAASVPSRPSPASNSPTTRQSGKTSLSQHPAVLQLERFVPGCGNPSSRPPHCNARSSPARQQRT